MPAQPLARSYAGGVAGFAPLSYRSFTIGEEIGKGRFKKVCKGVLRGGEGEESDVVILRYARTGERKELEILACLAGIEEARAFVPWIHGSCEERPESLILQERAVFGSLKTALAEGSSIRQDISPAHRVVAASKVSHALAFLETVRIVHADMSCRNCLLCNLEEDPLRTVVKVTDFGLAHLLPEGTSEVARKQPQAVRWCAPETIAHTRMSPQADAWALGVTLWELFSGGATPWCRREKRAHVSLILRVLGEAGPGPPGIAAVQRELREAAPEAEPFDGVDYEFPLPEDCPHIVYDLVLTTLRVAVESCAGRPGRSSALDLARAFDRFIEKCLRAVGQAEENAVALPEKSCFLVKPLALKSRRLVQHSVVLASEASVCRVTSNRAVVDFADWATPRWDQLHEAFARDVRDPSGGAFPDSGHRSRTMRLERWVELLRAKGFKGDAHAVFEQIACEEVGQQPSQKDQGVEAAVITLAQLKRFEARLTAATAGLSAADQGSVANRFARQLRQSRGTVLRGWRMDVDLRGTGRVALTDFTTACRKLGGNVQPRLIWDCLRKEGRTAPLEFHELAPEEADNIEALAEILIARFGFNLDAAWKQMDEHHQNYLAFQDFNVAARQMGFDGDTKVLFRGLDISGLGRVLREDFMYLGKVSTQSPHGRLAQNGPLPDLVAFMRREATSIDEFLGNLGIAPCQTEIAINDLSARLTAVGFEGDALRASAHAARSSGGSRVTVEVLRTLLSGERLRDSDGGSTIASLAPPVAMRIRPPPMYKEAWNNSVDDLSSKNLSKCHSVRSYFDGLRK